VLIIARTDARAPLGLTAAIERANAYAEAGADMIFVEAPQSVDEIERIGREVPAPLLINLVQGGLTPSDTPAGDLAAWGFRLAIHPGAGLAAATGAMLRSLAALRGVDAAPLAQSGPEGLFNLLGLAGWAELGERYRTDQGEPRWA
jgi:2-methylisocitrate lyase-like PEP mutase family enzyme